MVTIDSQNPRVNLAKHATPIEIARALGGEAKGNKVLCPGPNHSKHDRSLSIEVNASSAEGFIVYSFAGDDPIACRDYVRAKLGLPAWNETKTSAKAKNTAPKRKIVAEYNYEDEAGNTLFQAVRFQPKGFSQRSPDGRGDWVWSLKGVRLVPYRLPDLIEAASLERRIFIVEGEKDVEALFRIGCAATCNPMGAGKWRAEYAEYFRGTDIVILPDNDKQGHEHARKVSAALLSVAGNVRVVELPGLSDKGDVSDWIAAGGTAEALDQIIQYADTHNYDGDRLDRAKDKPLSNGKLNGKTPHFDWRAGTIPARALSALEIPDVVWTIPEIMPEGVSILAAKPKVGKSWLTLAWCIAIASDRKDRDLIFDADYRGIKPKDGSVLYLALEDNRRRMKSRLYKLCIESPEHLHINTEWPRCGQGGVEAIEEWIMDRIEAHGRGECPRPALVAIDTLAKFRPQANAKKGLYDQDYDAITPLKALADKYAIAILIIHHQRKMESEDPFDSVSGSLGLTGAADTIMVMARKDGGIVFMQRGRDVEEDEIAIQFNRDSGKWKALGSPQDVMRSSNDKAIIAVLKDAYMEAKADGERNLTIAEIKDRSGVKMSKPVFKNHVLRMAKDGKIERAERGKYRFCLR